MFVLNPKDHYIKYIKMKDSNKKLSLSRIVFLTAIVLVVIITPLVIKAVIPFFKKDEGYHPASYKKQENKKPITQDFVMSESFFKRPVALKVQEPKKPDIPKIPENVFNDIFKTKPKPELKKVNNEEKEFFESRNFFSSSEVITYNNNGQKVNKKAGVIDLLADKDYPSSVASKEYDLTRLLPTTSFIPAVMYTAVNSELASRSVIAIVESNVFGFHGRQILIPKGSKIEGVYEELTNQHQRRMQISWYQIMTPAGSIIKLDSESSDSHGVSGVSGYLDQRLKDRYGGALLLSAINAMAQMSVDQDNLSQLAALEAFSRQFGTLTATVIRENLNVMPSIMIAQGTRFNIRPHKSIYFPKTKDKVMFVNPKKS